MNLNNYSFIFSLSFTRKMTVDQIRKRIQRLFEGGQAMAGFFEISNLRVMHDENTEGVYVKFVRMLSEDLEVIENKSGTQDERLLEQFKEEIKLAQKEDNADYKPAYVSGPHYGDDVN